MSQLLRLDVITELNSFNQRKLDQACLEYLTRLMVTDSAVGYSTN